METAGSHDSRAKWQGPAAGERYAGERFATPRHRERDGAFVTCILRGHGLAGRSAFVLDAPCGAGRLRPAIERLEGARYAGLDVSAEMLAEAAPAGGRLVRGELASMPFRAASFDAVVCCRLLHHLHTQPELERVARELVRVSRELILASFWDSSSLPALRVRIGLKRCEGPRGRVAHARELLAGVFERAGAPVIGFRTAARFFSQQTFLVARRRA